MFPGGTEPFLVRNSLILGSLSGCDAFEIFSNTTDIPGFRAHPTTCQDNPDFVDALSYNCTAWLDYSCSSQENTSAYTAHEVRDVRRNCPVTCGTWTPPGFLCCPNFVAAVGWQGAHVLGGRMLTMSRCLCRGRRR